MARPLEVLADLELSVDGEPIDIRGTGDRIVVDLPTLRAGRRLLTSGPFVFNRPKRTRQLHEALRVTELSVEVRLRGDPIAQIGKGAEPGSLSRLLNVEGVELKPTRPLRAAARRRPVLTALVAIGLLVGLGWWLFRRRG